MVNRKSTEALRRVFSEPRANKLYRTVLIVYSDLFARLLKNKPTIYNIRQEIILMALSCGAIETHIIKEKNYL